MPSPVRILELQESDVTILAAVNDLLSALGLQPIPDDGPDSIAQRIASMAEYVRRTGAADHKAMSDGPRKSKLMQLAAHQQRQPVRSRQAIAADLAQRRGISIEQALQFVPE